MYTSEKTSTQNLYSLYPLSYFPKFWPPLLLMCFILFIYDKWKATFIHEAKHGFLKEEIGLLLLGGVLFAYTSVLSLTWGICKLISVLIKAVNTYQDFL